MIEPTFIVDYPVEVSPLSRLSDDKEGIVDRFELFIGGNEIANGFSELNDPEDQAERFKAQVEQKASGDEAAAKATLARIINVLAKLLSSCLCSLLA